MHRWSLSKLTVCAGAFVLLGLSPGSATERRSNVLFIAVDDLRPELGCYGDSHIHSPNIDALAASGVLFEDVTCQWPWTIPSMLSMFQGQYIVVNTGRLQEDCTTLPEAFQQAGYRTIGVVGNVLLDEDAGFARGFDSFQIVDSWENEELKIRARSDIEFLREMAQAPLQEALALDADGERAPLFFYVHAFDPHDPYLPHPEYASELPAADIAPVQPVGWWREQLPDFAGLNKNRRKNWEASLERMAIQRGFYDQEIRFFDQGLRNILDDLQRLGISDDAIHALVADHGEGLWEHESNIAPAELVKQPPHLRFYRSHGGNGYETALATPFVLWGGGIPTGRRVSQGVENVDLYPTLLELANIAPRAEFDGTSLVPLMNGNVQEWREHTVSLGAQTASVRDLSTQMKLILPQGRALKFGKQTELFDLNADPGERNNLAPQRTEVVRVLTEIHDRWRAARLQAAGGRAVTQRDAAGQEALSKKLGDLGYTEVDTGIPAAQD